MPAGIGYGPLGQALERAFQQRLPAMMGGGGIDDLPQNPRLPYPTPDLRPAPDQVPAPPNVSGAPGFDLQSFLKNPKVQEMLLGMLQGNQQPQQMVQSGIQFPPNAGIFAPVPTQPNVPRIFG